MGLCHFPSSFSRFITSPLEENGQGTGPARGHDGTGGGAYPTKGHYGIGIARSLGGLLSRSQHHRSVFNEESRSSYEQHCMQITPYILGVSEGKERFLFWHRLRSMVYRVFILLHCMWHISRETIFSQVICA